jgi:micrococcal nuclease
MKIRFGILASALLALSAFGYPAKVISIIDGDTIHVLVADKQDVKIRLSGIDAPEQQQPFSKQSEQALSDKILGQTVEVKAHDTDRYGRTVADVFLGDRWINLEMVADGWSWHYVAYSSDRRLAEAEQKARKKKAGLWADRNPVPPWKFRQ